MIHEQCFKDTCHQKNSMYTYFPLLDYMLHFEPHYISRFVGIILSNSRYLVRYDSQLIYKYPQDDFMITLGVLQTNQ